MAAAAYDLSVFVNCPFDDRFRGLMRAMVFTIHDCGFIARSALEVYDSSQVRIDKITKIVSECKLGLHDISRTDLDPRFDLPRFNMPLELGIFLGAKWLGLPKQRKKVALVLDRERYRYQKFCSDIAGQDVEAHDDDPKTAVRVVRNWLRSARPEVAVPGGSKIFERYVDFLEDLPLYCEVLQLDPEELTFSDHTNLVVAWQTENEW